MNFKTEREKRDLVQFTVSKAMGMTQPSYARIESGQRNPTKQHLASFRMAMMLFDKGLWELVLKDDPL